MADSGVRPKETFGSSTSPLDRPARPQRSIAAVPAHGQRERPTPVEDRAIPGHWEGDLLTGSKNSYLVTLLERHTRYVMLAKIPSRDTQTVVKALIKQAKQLAGELYKSLTWDRGKELTDHKRFTLATDIAVYFCDPQSPWQRAPARTPIDCYSSTSREAPISRYTARHG